MKLTLIVANVVAAIAFYVFGGMAVSAHRTHAFSVYRELQAQHVLVERPDYDVEKRLVTIADGGRYYLFLSQFGVAVCLVNAVVIGFVGRKPKAH